MSPEVSIFNDVLGPIMRGPSSSHTAGAYRIARIAKELAGNKPMQIRCTFDPTGSYSATWRPLGVDLAFAAGTLGWEMTDSRYPSAMSHAGTAGMPIVFDVESLPNADHPNAIRVEMLKDNGDTLTLRAKSTGGGIVEITHFGTWSVSIDGRSWTVLVECATSNGAELALQAQAILGPSARLASFAEPQSGLLQFEIDAEPSADALARLERLEGATRVRRCSPVLLPQPGQSSYGSIDEMCSRADDKELSLGEMGLTHEGEVLGLPAHELTEEM
ncbi:MAG: hypothetical protein GY906_16295, partial [bacterium]|nr:hypothetical protein [bacterium]